MPRIAYPLNLRIVADRKKATPVRPGVMYLPISMPARVFIKITLFPPVGKRAIKCSITGG